MKKIAYLLLSIFALGCIFNCDQYPIFYTTAKEVAPKKAKIPGALSMIIATPDGKTLYVTNHSSIWTASENTGWIWAQHSLPPSGTAVQSIACANTNLYALTSNANESVIWKIDGNSASAIERGNSKKYQVIYGAGGKIFAAVSIRDTPTEGGADYSIVNITDNVTVVAETHLLKGVAYSNSAYYFATMGSGIYSGNGSSATQLDLGKNKTIMGIISYGALPMVAAISRDGYVYQLTGTAAEKETGRDFRDGALGVWWDPLRSGASNPSTGYPALLLIGVRINNIQHGYHEMKIKPDGTLDFAGSLEYPGVHIPTS
ncbi:MAG: hypothetical protein LBD22_03705, partial [Spirochaetaceae bacterium]|nr:hypothetical protein [Spirochaetaceae bacterium]